MTVARTGTRTLLLCGYYGENNLGDDALLQVLLQQIPADFGLLITANDREALRQLAPMAESVSRTSCSVGSGPRRWRPSSVMRLWWLMWPVCCSGCWSVCPARGGWRGASEP